MPITYNDFLPRVAPFVKNVTNAMLQSAVQRAGREFLVETELWETSQTIDSVTDQTDYTIVLPTSAQLGRVTKVTMDGSLLREQSAYIVTGENTLALTYAPEEDDLPIKVWAVFYPIQKWVDFPQGVFDRWAETIADGALSYLYGMAGMPWENMAAYQVRTKAFTDGISMARAQHDQGRLSGDVRFTAPISAMGWP